MTEIMSFQNQNSTLKPAVCNRVTQDWRDDHTTASVFKCYCGLQSRDAGLAQLAGGLSERECLATLLVGLIKSSS